MLKGHNSLHLETICLSREIMSKEMMVAFIINSSRACLNINQKETIFD